MTQRPSPAASWILGENRRLGAVCLAVSALLIAAYATYFAHVTTDAYRGYGYRTFDLALYDQGVWLLSRFHAPFVTSIGRNLFGDHAQYSLLALVALYWIRPDATTLLVVHALVLALGAVPVYLLTLRSGRATSRTSTLMRSSFRSSDSRSTPRSKIGRA